jgi:hypothetical protein
MIACLPVPGIDTGCSHHGARKAYGSIGQMTNHLRELRQ